MKTPGLNDERSTGAPSRLSLRKYAKWIPVSEIDDWLRHHSTGSGRRKIFAIVAPPIPVDRGGKTVRRILIFDNHPDTLRLVSERRLNPDVDLATGRVRPASGPAAPGQARPSHVILGLVLILTLVLAMFWPLFVI